MKPLSPDSLVSAWIDEISRHFMDWNEKTARRLFGSCGFIFYLLVAITGMIWIFGLPPGFGR